MIGYVRRTACFCIGRGHGESDLVNKPKDITKTFKYRML